MLNFPLSSMSFLFVDVRFGLVICIWVVVCPCQQVDIKL